MSIDKLIKIATFVSDPEELRRLIGTKGSLRVKAGFDPTRPDLHLGHVVLLDKMRQLQEMGHHIILVVGDFTARIGDPTGKNVTRPPLSEAEVRAAALTYQEQAFKILDKSRTEVRFNSEWLSELTAQQMVELSARYTVARMLERHDFSARFVAHQPIAMHEFLYPLLQAYDSVVLDADLELGGRDQLFNLMVGRDLMPRYGKPAQAIMTFPILEGTNAIVDAEGKVLGDKMSKSLGNDIAITATPDKMLHQLMMLDDSIVWRYMELLSATDAAAQSELQARVVAGTSTILEIKSAMAQEIVTRLHSAEAFQSALTRRQEIAKGGFPADAPVIVLDQATSIGKALFLAGVATSGTDGGRLAKGGAVTINGAQIRDDKFTLISGEYEIKVGSKNRKFVRITVK